MASLFICKKCGAILEKKGKRWYCPKCEKIRTINRIRVDI